MESTTTTAMGKTPQGFQVAPRLAPPRTATEEALRFWRKPLHTRTFKKSPLPPNMTVILKVASGHQETIDEVCALHGISQPEMEDAAKLYLQNIVATAGDDDYRILCLTAPLDASQLKEHKRYLLKWLHPDINHNSWQSNLFGRVKDASERLSQSLREESPVHPASPVMSAPAKQSRHVKRRALRSQAVSKRYIYWQTSGPIVMISIAIVMSCATVMLLYPNHPVVRGLVSVLMRQ